MKGRDEKLGPTCLDHGQAYVFARLDLNKKKKCGKVNVCGGDGHTEISTWVGEEPKEEPLRTTSL